MSTAEGTQSIDLVQIGEATTTESWLVSDWATGQSSIMEWSPDNVVEQADGSVQFTLAAAPEGSAYAYCGGEVQSCEAASTGTWTWTAQAPVMQDGAVFGMFTYRADHFNDPWIEFDFEFIGANTNQVRLNIHMETATGEHVTLEQGNNWQPVIVNLGFDASQGLHTYEITVTGTEAIFLVDGQVLGRFGSADMPYGTWTTGEMKGFANLWCVDPSLENWAGDWAYGGTPLTATIAAIDVLPGDLGSFTPTVLIGDAGDNVLVGNAGDDTLSGHAGNDTLTGGDGNDTLSGGDGNDTLQLDGGDDLLDGGVGVDWVRVAGAGPATIDLALTTAQATGYGNDVLLAIENARGGAGNDTLAGTDTVNTLLGDTGHDTLAGRGGDDRLDGGAGTDRLEGGAGNDIFIVDSVGDVVIEVAGEGADSVYSAVSWSLGAEVEYLVLTGTAAINGTGNVLANRITGNAASNVLLGGAGADSLNGGAGTDRLEGGADNDSYVVDSLSDVVVEVAGGGVDQISAAVSWTLGAEIENLVLTGTAAINATGNALANRLTGNAANNMLKGGAGNDALSGGGGQDILLGEAGKDTLTGGLGDDAFQFMTLIDAGDVVTDFHATTGDNDLFRISATGFGGGLVAGTTLSAAQFVARADNLAQDSDDRFVFRTTDQTLWFDSNGNVSGGLTLLADLQAGAAVASSDVLLV